MNVGVCVYVCIHGFMYLVIDLCMLFICLCIGLVIKLRMYLSSCLLIHPFVYLCIWLWMHADMNVQI